VLVPRPAWAWVLRCHAGGPPGPLAAQSRRAGVVAALLLLLLVRMTVTGCAACAWGTGKAELQDWYGELCYAAADQGAAAQSWHACT